MPERYYGWSLAYSIDKRGIPRPLIPVTFTYRQPTRIYAGLVDSGADWSAIHVDIAREAGIDLDAFPERSVRGIGGTMRARRCPIDLHILQRRIATEVY